MIPLRSARRSSPSCAIPTGAAAMASAAAPRLHDYRLDAIAGRFADLYEQLYAEATLAREPAGAGKGARWAR